MSEFSIHVNNVNQYTEDLRDYSKDILQLQIRLRTATTKLALQTMAQPMIRKKLNQLNEDMFTEYLKMNRMNRTASNVVNTYVKTEKSLLGENNYTINKELVGIANIKKSFSESKSINWGALVKNFISKSGFVGGMGIGLYNLITGGEDNGAKTRVSGVKGIYGAIKSLVKTQNTAGKDTTVSWKDYILDMTKPLSDYTGAKEAFSKTLSGKFDIKSEGVGWLLTFVEEGFENYDEYGEMSNRAIAETIGESAVKITEGALISAGVSAAFVALGLAGAPAVAVAGATVLVTWGLDTLSEQLTGKKLDELVSDTVLDFGESFISKVDDVKETIKDKVGDTVKNIKEGVSSIWASSVRRFSLSW